VGDVQLDAPDLHERLSVLRKTATDLDHTGLTCKLVIPNSQILYTTIDAPGPNDDDRLEQIKSGLVGLTPYDVSDLVFDWRIDGATAQVAVVASETLREAENFAADFRFNPVSFVGITTPDNFEAEPFFGMTSGAATILGADASVERDSESITVVVDTQKSVPTAPVIKPDPIPVQTPVAEAASKPATENVATAPRPDPQTESMAKPTFKSAKASLAVQVENNPPASVPIDAETQTPVAFASRRSAEAIETTPPPAAPPEATRSSVADYSALDLNDVPDMPAWRAAANPPASAATDGEALLAVTSPITADPQPSAALPKARYAAAAPINGQAETAMSRKAAIAASSQEAKAMTVFGARGEQTVGGKPKYLGLMLTILLLLAFAVAALWSSLFLTETESTAPTTSPAPEASALESTAPTTASGTETETGTTATALPEATPESTVGANETSEPPLQSAIETAISDALLVPTDPSLPDVPLQTATSGDTVLPSDESQVAGVESTPVETPTISAPSPDRVAEAPPNSAEAERRYAITGIWQRDPAPLAEPVASGQLENLQTASIDPTFTPGTFSALPSSGPDTRPDSLTPPGRLRASFDLDERGLVAATPEGNLSPDGTLVYLGNPPIVPGVRPGTPLPEVTLTIPETALPASLPGDPTLVPETDTETGEPLTTEPTPKVVPETETATEEAPVVEAPEVEAPAVASTTEEVSPPVTSETSETTTTTETTEVTPGETETPLVLTPEQERMREFRPVPRPSSIDETLNATTDDGSEQALDLANIRPQVRPASVEEEALASAAPAPEEEDPATEETDPAPEETVQPPSELAIAASSLPNARPRAVERRAAKAIANARREAEENSQSAPARTVAAAVVTPNIPSRASVARAATDTNAIPLSKVNLIGVYGSKSDRRALVRLKNGRYVKVEVGDRVDGGRVAAIGSNELRYVKSGRNITLKMPKG